MNAPRRQTPRNKKLTKKQQALVLKYLPMARARAAHWAGRTDGDDLFQEAALELCRAARTFDPKKGVYPHIYFRRWLINLEAKWHVKMARGREYVGCDERFLERAQARGVSPWGP